jgi:hypothetical protein
MPAVCYIPKKFNAEHAQIIANANEICAFYIANYGMTLTLRELYYQFVSKNLIANKQSEYDRLQSILDDARKAGAMDWEYMIDRTRNRIERSHWDNPGTLLEAVTKQYHVDLWKGQQVRPILFVEKDAALGSIEGICHENDVPYFSCRGYTSSSELWSAAQRIRWDIENGDRVVILHMGDHDPSGLDMTRDIEERISRFLWKDWLLTWGRNGLTGKVTVGDIKAHMQDHMVNIRHKLYGNDAEPVVGSPFVVKRIALNLNQIEQYDPPPNPAKKTDARYQRYVEETGLDDSWELDSLAPDVRANLVLREIELLRDEEKWAKSYEVMERERITLRKITDHYTPVVNFVNGLDDKETVS